MTTSFLVIVQIVLVIILTIAVLLQKSSSIGLGAYSGSNESVFGAKGPNSFLAKVTFLIGFLFVANTITLGYLYATASKSSVVDALIETTNVAAPVASKETAPVTIETPSAPVTETPAQTAPAVAVEETSTQTTK